MQKEELKKFGKHLRELRKSRNLTLSEFCYKNSLEPSTVSRIETGIVEAKYLTLLNIAKALGMTLSELFNF